MKIKFLCYLGMLIILLPLVPPPPPACILPRSAPYFTFKECFNTGGPVHA